MFRRLRKISQCGRIAIGSSTKLMSASGKQRGKTQRKTSYCKRWEWTFGRRPGDSRIFGLSSLGWQGLSCSQHVKEWKWWFRLTRKSCTMRSFGNPFVRKDNGWLSPLWSGSNALLKKVMLSTYGSGMRISRLTSRSDLSLETGITRKCLRTSSEITCRSAIKWTPQSSFSVWSTCWRSGGC